MKKFSMFFYLFLALTTISFTSCDKNDDNDCDITMKFQDMTGLDGCGFILVLNLDDEERRLEPTNLSDFDITPVDGLEVCGTFETGLDLASICMVGEIVRLTSLSVK